MGTQNNVLWECAEKRENYSRARDRNRPNIRHTFELGPVTADSAAVIGVHWRGRIDGLFGGRRGIYPGKLKKGVGHNFIGENMA